MKFGGKFKKPSRLRTFSNPTSLQKSKKKLPPTLKDIIYVTLPLVRIYDHYKSYPSLYYYTAISTSSFRLPIFYIHYHIALLVLNDHGLQIVQKKLQTREHENQTVLEYPIIPVQSQKNEKIGL